jgi:hypothetical protein
MTEELWGIVYRVPGAPNLLMVFVEEDAEHDERAAQALANRIGELLAPHKDELDALALKVQPL